MGLKRDILNFFFFLLNLFVVEGEFTPPEKDCELFFLQVFVEEKADSKEEGECPASAGTALTRSSDRTNLKNTIIVMRL